MWGRQEHDDVTDAVGAREEDAGTVHVEGGTCDFWYVADENSVGA
jgi:hypothetical protein